MRIVSVVFYFILKSDIMIPCTLQRVPARENRRDLSGGFLIWTLRISSGVSKGIDKSVVQSGRDFPYIRVGGGQ